MWNMFRSAANPIFVQTFTAESKTEEYLTTTSDTDKSIPGHNNKDQTMNLKF